nr:hypothetical protein [Tanacetum cinerariifolium]
MTSFGYRLNPHYAIKECSSSGALYTRDFCCSKRNVEDKILVLKLPKNYARCARCRHPVDGLYCQGCVLLRKKLEEDLVTYLQDFQNTSESSDDSTNVVNAPREPFVVKQDHGVNSSQNPPHIDECCCKCGDALDGIFCQQCTCKSCGKAWDRVFEIKDAFGNKQYKPEDIQELFRELFNDVQNIHEELAEYINTLGWNHPAFCNNGDDDDDDYNSAITPNEPVDSLSMVDEHLDTILAMELDKVIKSSVEDLVLIPSESEGISDTMCDVHLVNNPTPLEAKDHFEIVINSNDDYFSSDGDSLYNENIEYVEASPHDSELASLEVAEIVILEDEEIEDDNLREKLLNVHLLIANIEALKYNPTPSFEFLTKSSSTSPKSFLEETNTFDNFFPEFENFCFDLEEISSGSTTTLSDISLLDYEAFYFDNDHIKDISSGSTTTHSDISLSEYDSFIFDLLNDQFPPTDRSDFTHEEFTDELVHIISLLEYDCFYFRNFPDPGEWISNLNSRIRENLSSTTHVNLLVEDDHSPLLVYVVWISLAYLMYPVIPPYLHSFGNKDTIFDPGIAINRFYSFKPDVVFHLLPYGPMNSGSNRACDSVNKNKDYPDCEVSRALSFCLSFTRNSHPQLHFGNPLLFEVISRGRLKFLVFLSAYFIALRGDTQHLSMGDFGNGYSRKRQKQSPKRQNQTRNGKDRERQSHLKPKDKSQSPRSTKVNPEKVKVNPGKVKVNPDKAEVEKTKKINLRDQKCQTLKVVLHAKKITRATFAIYPKYNSRDHLCQLFKLVSPKEELCNVIFMLFLITEVDENIIDEHYHKFIQELIFKVHGLRGAAPGTNLIWNSTWRTGGTPVPSQMTHLVPSITLHSARSCMMQGAFLTQGTVSSIPTVLSWGGIIRPEGFWPSILLLIVIIVTVAIVVAVVLVIVDMIIGIVVVVVGAPSVIKLAFVITGSLHRTTLYYLIHQPLGYVDGFL